MRGSSSYLYTYTGFFPWYLKYIQIYLYTRILFIIFLSILYVIKYICKTYKQTNSNNNNNIYIYIYIYICLRVCMRARSRACVYMHVCACLFISYFHIQATRTPIISQVRSRYAKADKLWQFLLHKRQVLKLFKYNWSIKYNCCMTKHVFTCCRNRYNINW